MNSFYTHNKSYLVVKHTTLYWEEIFEVEIKQPYTGRSAINHKEQIRNKGIHPLSA